MSMTESEATKLTYRGREGKAYCDHSVREIICRLADYEDIGTVSEFRELKEKATAKPKKIIYVKQKCGLPWICPDCGAEQIKRSFKDEDNSNTFCWECGIVLDWSEGKE